MTTTVNMVTSNAIKIYDTWLCISFVWIILSKQKKPLLPLYFAVNNSKDIQQVILTALSERNISLMSHICIVYNEFCWLVRCNFTKTIKIKLFLSLQTQCKWKRTSVGTLVTWLLLLEKLFMFEILEQNVYSIHIAFNSIQFSS